MYALFSHLLFCLKQSFWIYRLPFKNLGSVNLVLLFFLINYFIQQGNIKLIEKLKTFIRLQNILFQENAVLLIFLLKNLKLYSFNLSLEDECSLFWKIDWKFSMTNAVLFSHYRISSSYFSLSFHYFFFTSFYKVCLTIGTMTVGTERDKFRIEHTQKTAFYDSPL